MKQRKNKMIFLLVAIGFSFLSCAISTQKKVNNNYKIALVESIHFESKYLTDLSTDEKKQISNEDSKYIENVIAITSKENDSVTTYNFQSDLYSKPIKNIFTSQRKNKFTRIFINFKENEEVQVEFKAYNIIKIKNDLYTLNQPYYEFLKKEILEKGSIIELIRLIKDGYGDYCPLFDPLIDYKWTGEALNKDYKINEVLINSINYQSVVDEEYPWKIIYSERNANGERFRRSYIKDTDKYTIYEVEGTINERSEYNETHYKNKKTSLDSIVGSWFLYSTNIEYKYTKYQSILEIVVADKPPKNVQSMLKLFEDYIDETKTDEN